VTGAPARILVVDDDRDARAALAALLNAEGYEVVAVTNGEEALAVLRRDGAVRLVLLDLMMPVMDGFTFLRERALDRTLGAVPVVVTSALDCRGDLDVAAYLHKPVDPDDLLSIIERYCQAT
jgi:two-component system chemotaxis response regulator CheY